MGLIEKLMEFVFGGGVQSTVEVFRENSEKSAALAHVLQQAALTQFATEFRNPRSGFDRFIDGVNRLPRPAMAFGVLAFSSRRLWVCRSHGGPSPCARTLMVVTGRDCVLLF